MFTNAADVNEKARELKEVSINNSFDFLSDLLGFELKEVEAMQEAVETREAYESNIYLDSRSNEEAPGQEKG